MASTRFPNGVQCKKHTSTHRMCAQSIYFGCRHPPCLQLTENEEKNHLAFTLRKKQQQKNVLNKNILPATNTIAYWVCCECCNAASSSCEHCVISETYVHNCIFTTLFIYYLISYIHSFVHSDLVCFIFFRFHFAIFRFSMILPPFRILPVCECIYFSILRAVRSISLSQLLFFPLFSRSFCLHFSFREQKIHIYR